MPLYKDRNEIMVAIYRSVHDDARARTAYEWGLAMRVEDLRGITLARRDKLIAWKPSAST